MIKRSVARQVYYSFYSNFDLRHDPNSKLKNSFLFFSTIDAIKNFHYARKGYLVVNRNYTKEYDKYERISMVVRGIFGLVPGVNLLLYPIMGVGTLVGIIVDVVRARRNKKTGSVDSAAVESDSDRSIHIRKTSSIEPPASEMDLSDQSSSEESEIEPLRAELREIKFRKIVGGVKELCTEIEEDEEGIELPEETVDTIEKLIDDLDEFLENPTRSD